MEKDYKIVKSKIPKGYSYRMFEVIGEYIYIYCEPEMKWELLNFGIQKNLCKKKKK